MKDFADLQKRPDKAPEQPIQKPLQRDDIWPKPKKKVAGYGAGGYGKTVPGGLKDYDPYGLDKQVYGDSKPPSLDKFQAAVSTPDVAPRSVVRLKDYDPYGLDAQVYGDKPPSLDKRQAVVEQNSGVPTAAEPVQVASAAVKGHGAKLESPEQQLYHKFETDVSAKTQRLLKANKDRLNAEQKNYTQDKDPKSERWQHLWKVAAQRQSLETKERALKAQLNAVSEEFNNPPPPGIYDGKTREQIQQTDYYKKSVKLQAQKEKLKAQIQQAHQMQISLEYTYPALSAVKGETGKDPQDIQKVQGRLPGEFNGIRSHIDQLSGEIKKDPSTALLFDSAVVQQLNHGKYNAQQMKELTTWLKGERDNKNRMSMLGQLLGGGLFVASFIPQLRGGGSLLRMLGAGTLGATFAYDLPDLLLLDAAAQSGRGGAGNLTGQTPEQARFNLVMGYANVGLAGLDMGLEAGVVRGLQRIPALVKSASSLTQIQSRVLMESVMRLKGNVSDGLIQKMAQVVKGADRLTAQTIVNADGTLTQSRPLGQVADRMETTAAARSSTTAAKSPQIAANLSDEAAEKLLAKYPQWNNVKDFVGKHLDPNNLPPGYKYRVKNNKPELYRDSTEGPFPPLTVKNGLVTLQTGQSTRLSVFSRYKKNYLEWVEQTQGKAARTAAEQRLAEGNQLHHLVPDAVVRDNPLTKELMKRSKTYTLDRGTNILDMPMIHDPKTGEIVHLGSHPKFNNYVNGLLGQSVDVLTRGRTIPLSKVKVGDMDAALQQVENMLRSQIKNRTLPPDILELIEGGGFKISEGSQNQQGGDIA